MQNTQGKLPILVVDDDDQERGRIVTSLVGARYQVREARSGEEGLDVLRSDLFGCLLTDLRMPSMGGNIVMQQARHLDPNLPVIIVGNRADMREILECLRAGAFDYLIKPCADGDLLEAVQGALALRTTRDDAPAPMRGSHAPPPPQAAAATAQPAPPAKQPAAPSVQAAPAPGQPPSPASPVDDGARPTPTRASTPPAVGRASPPPETQATKGATPPPTTSSSSVPPAPARKSTPPEVMRSRKAALAMLVQRIRAEGVQLPAVAAVAMEVRRLMDNDRSSAFDLKAVIEKDAHLTGRVIRIANNPYYAGNTRITDLQSALARMGLREIRQILDTLFAHEFYSVRVPTVQATLNAIWMHSWARGVVMRALAVQVRGLNIGPERAFLAGLFGDAGAPYLYKLLSEIAPNAEAEDMNAFVAEQHAVVGATITKAWKLHDDCALVAGSHHHAEAAASTAPYLRLAVAAEPICIEIGITGDPGPVPDGQAVLEALVPDPANRQALVIRVRDYMDKHAPSFGSAAPAK